MSGFEILVFIFVLGVLIFVHELGHFLAAKACGVYVDQFSLGMPPRIMGFKIGETDYCIGLLPIGGYVKMAGQEDAPLSEDEREQTYGHVPSERWFNNKPVWQRAIVMAAGPAMNFVLALFIYGAIAATGREVPLPMWDTRVGLVEEGSPAENAPMYRMDGQTAVNADEEPDAIGWRTGDRILRINGKPMERFEDIFFEAVLGKGNAARVVIERPLPDGTSENYLSLVEPKILDEEIQATRFGFAPYSSALIQYVIPDSPAEAHGLQAGDVIVRAGGQPVDSNTFSNLVRALEAGDELAIEVKRGDEIIPLDIATRTEGRIDGIGFSPPLRPFLLLPDHAQPTVNAEDSELLARTGLRTGDRLTSVNDRSDIGHVLRELYKNPPEEAITLTVERSGLLGRSGETLSKELSFDDLLYALTGSDPSGPVTLTGVARDVEETTGLQRRDVIVAIEGEPATARKLRTLEQERVDGTIGVTVERPALLYGVAQGAETFEAEIPVKKVEQIGVVWGTETIVVRSEPGEIIPAAFAESMRVTGQTFATIQRLVTGGLSPKLLGGPVMIAEVTTQAARDGFLVVLERMALISINLAIFNLLPLPVLDGGQLVLLLIEAVRRKPVNMRVLETVQQVGIILILGLIVYVTFNDITRVVGRWMP